MTAWEADYQAHYRRFRAFIECTNKATQLLREGLHAMHSSRHTGLCYTKLPSGLLLCNSCAAFWRECKANADHTTWEMAVFLRDLRQHRDPRLTSS